MLSGGYNSDGKVSPQGKRKREKAQLKLRDQMRRKMHGQHSSTDLQRRPRHPAMAQTNRSLPSVTSLGATTESTKRSLLHRDGYWRTQHDRYDKMVHVSHITRNREQVSIQGLVERVAERRERQDALQNNSLLTIRSYKRPTGPYAIQQQPLIKKVVGIPAIQPSKKSQKKGPYVLVLQTPKKTKVTGKRSGSDMDPTANSASHSDISDTDTQDSITGSDEGGTTAPPVSPHPRTRISMHPPKDIEERYVPNYQPEIRQTNEFTEARSLYATKGSTNNNFSDREIKTLHKFSALPSIPSAQSKKEYSENAETSPGAVISRDNPDSYGAIEMKTGTESEDSSNDGNNGDNEPAGAAARYKSRKGDANEILKVMEARKRARRAKRADSDFQTLLRTRNKHTTDTKMFKEDLLNMSRLSIISETNSGTPDELQRVSSAERTSSRASIASLKSIPSLEKIDETEIMKDPIGERMTPRALKSPGAIYLIKEEPGDVCADVVSVYTSPTSSVRDGKEAVGGGGLQTAARRGSGGERVARDAVGDGKFEGMKWVVGDEEFVEVM